MVRFEELPISANDLDLLMRKLGVPSSEVPDQIAGTGAWLLQKWRRTGLFCCIKVDSDYSYVWYVSWSYSDMKTVGKEHLDYWTHHSFEDFDHAIYVSALVAFGIRVEDLTVRKVRRKYQHMSESEVELKRKEIREFFLNR